MFFDSLNWIESHIESIQVFERQLTIVGSHAGTPEGPRRVRVTFEGVASAKREVTEYIGDPKVFPDFKQAYVVDELPVLELPKTSAFGMEGVSTFHPIAWLDIDIQAQGARVEIL